MCSLEKCVVLPTDGSMVSAIALPTWINSRQTPILASTRLCPPIRLGASQLYAESRSSPAPPAAVSSEHSRGLPLPVLEAVPRGPRALPPAALRRRKLLRLESRSAPTRALRGLRAAWRRPEPGDLHRLRAADTRRPASGLRARQSKNSSRVVCCKTSAADRATRELARPGSTAAPPKCRKCNW